MKILSLGTYIFAPTWRELGHRVLVVADFDLPAHPDTLRVDFFARPEECAPCIGSLIESFGPDVVFQGDHSAPLIHCGLESVSIPKVWFAIDTHLHRAWHKHYAALFDHVFCAQQNKMAILREYGQTVEWLPPFCQAPTGFLPWARRTVEVAFVGTVNAATNPDRARLFDAIRQRGIPIHTATGAYAPVYQSSKIVVNQAVADDLNLRFFEATGCGALLITDRLSHSMNDILHEGVEFLTYEHNDAQDAAAKINWALAHPEEAERMARRAHEKITAAHLEEHAARRVLARLEQLHEEGPPAREDPDTATAHCAWAHDHCSRLKLPLPLSAFFAERAERLAASGRASQGRPWALLVLAGRALDRENFILARSLLMQITPVPGDPDFRLRYFSLKAEAGVLAGDRHEALQTLSDARREFPGDEGLEKMEAALRLRIADCGLRI